MTDKFADIVEERNTPEIALPYTVPEESSYPSLYEFGQESALPEQTEQSHSGAEQSGSSSRFPFFNRSRDPTVIASKASKKEEHRLAQEAEKQKRMMAEKASREMARAVMAKRAQLMLDGNEGAEKIIAGGGMGFST